MFSWLFERDFMPHGHCFFWQPGILWTEVISDGVIATAYFSIPVMLLYFLRRRPELPFPAMIVLFAAFIVLCGGSHVIDIWTVWQPVYPVQAVEKAATALVSIATAVMMVPIIPQVLAMRTPAEVEQEKLKALEQLGRTQSQLVQSERLASLGALVAGISHEINTPVGIGVTAASALRDRALVLKKAFDAGDLAKSDLERFIKVADESSRIILGNLERASGLIHSFKQIGVDQASGKRRQFDLREYLDEVLMSLKPQITRAADEVEVECPAGLMVDSYPGAIAQVLTNFVTNSLLHGFEGRKGGHIRITAQPEFDFSHVLLRYSDDGCGIPPENLRRVFEPFFTTRRGAGGSGLGLHIVHNVVTETLGGTVSVTSEPGKGTEFVVRFPLKAPARQPANGEPRGPAVNPAPARTPAPG